MQVEHHGGERSLSPLAHAAPLTETHPLVRIPALFALIAMQASLAAPVPAFERQAHEQESAQQIRADVRFAAHASDDSLRKQSCQTLQFTLEAAETHADWFEARHDLFSRADRHNASLWKRRVAEAIETKGC